jgi:hypothetical protein
MRSRFPRQVGQADSLTVPFCITTLSGFRSVRRFSGAGPLACGRPLGRPARTPHLLVAAKPPCGAGNLACSRLSGGSGNRLAVCNPAPQDSLAATFRGSVRAATVWSGLRAAQNRRGEQTNKDQVGQAGLVSKTVLFGCRKLAVGSCCLLLAALASAADTSAERGKHVIDQAVAALGGDRFLNMQDRVESGRAYSFYREQLSGLS